MMFGRDRGCLLWEADAYALPDAAGLWDVVVILMRRESRGRSPGSDPATMPMPSSTRDQKPILPVA
jgi:hypothetical protein